MQSPTRYASSDGVSIAYQVHGRGKIDLVFVPGFVSHVELVWEDPGAANLLNRLASFSRLILLDKRGQGLSDRIGRPPTLEETMEDVIAVMDAAGSDRAALFGVSEGGPMSLLAAATHPDRVRSLILYGTYARLLRGDGYEQGLRPRTYGRWGDAVIADWGSPDVARWWAPSAGNGSAFATWWGRVLRHGTSPSGARELMDLYQELDVRPVLETIRQPTLVLHRAEDRMLPARMGVYLAEHIAGARYVEMPGEDHVPFAGDTDRLADEIEEFLVGSRASRHADRALATVLFTDIVDSTATAARLGDQRWRELLAEHDAIVRRELRLHRGRELKSLGDGFLATFDGPARALRCARQIRLALEELEVEIRAGVHTGEIEHVGDDIGGIAVNIAARVEAAAEAREILASSTVKELVAGSGLEFDDRGPHALKGVPGEWRLFALAG